MGTISKAHRALMYTLYKLDIECTERLIPGEELRVFLYLQAVKKRVLQGSQLSPPSDGKNYDRVEPNKRHTM